MESGCVFELGLCSLMISISLPDYMYMYVVFTSTKIAFICICGGVVG